MRVEQYQIETRGDWLCVRVGGLIKTINPSRLLRLRARHLSFKQRFLTLAIFSAASAQISFAEIEGTQTDELLTGGRERSKVAGLVLSRTK